MIAAESMTGLICPGFSDVLAYIAAVLIIPVKPLEIEG